jgi:hypothetical protein
VNEIVTGAANRDQIFREFIAKTLIGQVVKIERFSKSRRNTAAIAESVVRVRERASFLFPRFG